MTYAQKYGKYGIYSDGMLYKWFKDRDNAEVYWSVNIVGDDNECAEEWLEAYDEVIMKDMKSGEILHDLAKEVR